MLHEFYKSFFNPREKDVLETIFKNPTWKQFVEVSFKNPYKENSYSTRAVIIDNDLYVAHPYRLTHDDFVHRHTPSGEIEIEVVVRTIGIDKVEVITGTVAYVRGEPVDVENFISFIGRHPQIRRLGSNVTVNTGMLKRSLKV